MHKRLVHGALLGLLLCAVPASAQNLVTNSSFDLANGITGWSSYGSALPADGTRAWAPDDSGGSPGSGSALLTILGTSAADAVVGLSQCLGVTAGSTYEFYSRIRTPLGQNANEARLVLEVAFFSDGGCATPLNLADGQGIVVGTAYPLDNATWNGIPGSAPTVEASLVAPPGAAGAELRYYLERIAGSSAVLANVDVVVLHDASTVPVTLTSFDAE